MDRKTWIQALPKAEYHLHLEGAVPWQFIREAGTDPFAEKPFWASPIYRYKDFDEFQQALSGSIRPLLITLEDYCRIAQAHLLQLKAENCLYVEMSISLGGLVRRGINPNELLKALQALVPEGMTLAMIIGFGRNGSHYTDEHIAEVLAAPLLAGIDISGDERLGNTERFIEVYAEARQRGLRTKVHAGELLDANFIHDTLDKLEPERIQHGISAAGDKALLKRLADNGISLDLCPSSNFMLNVVPDLARYPIRAFLDAGVDITLNTDDPTMFCCTLSSELLTMLEHKLISLREIAEMQHRAFEKALMSKEAIANAQAKIAVLLKAVDENLV